MSVIGGVSCKRDIATREVIVPDTTTDRSTAAPVSKGASFALSIPAVEMGMNPQNGQGQGRLQLSLVYVPLPKPGATSLPTCLSPFAPETEIGVVTCEEGSVAHVPLYARDVRQYCRVRDNPLGPGEGLPVFSLPGCKHIKVSLFLYEPRLKLETVP